MLFYPAVHLTLNTATDPFSEALNSHSVADLQSFKTPKEKQWETDLLKIINPLFNYGKALQTQNFHKAAEVIDTHKSKISLS